MYQSIHLSYDNIPTCTCTYLCQQYHSGPYFNVKHSYIHNVVVLFNGWMGHNNVTNEVHNIALSCIPYMYNYIHNYQLVVHNYKTSDGLVYSKI